MNKISVDMKNQKKQKEEVSLDIVCGNVDHLFTGNALCIVSILSGSVGIQGSGREKHYKMGGLRVLDPFSAYRCDAEEGAALLFSMPLPLLRLWGAEECGVIVCDALDDTVKGRSCEYDRVRTILANLWKLSFEEETDRRKKNLKAKTLDLFRLLKNFFAVGSDDIFQMEKEPAKQRINRIVNFIQEHWMEDLRITEIAEVVGLSPNYLSRFWHDSMGRPLSQYINDIRLEKAKKMLRGSGSITDVAISCGFADSNALNRNFKKKFGRMPKQYRMEFLSSGKKEGDREPGGEGLDLSHFLSYADDVTEVKKLQIEDRVVKLDWNTKGTEFQHGWRRLVNIGFAHDGLMWVVQQQLVWAQQDIGFEYVRFHGIFDEDMHIYNEDEEGELHLNFIFADLLLDFLLSINLKPYMELGYTPKALAASQTRELDRETYYSQVNDPKKWNKLVQLFITHVIGRYGIKTVRQWRFTVAGSELQLQGYLTQEEFLEHYCNTFRAVKAVEESLMFGGFGSHSNLILDTDQTEKCLEYCYKENCLPDFFTVQNFPIQSMESDVTASPILLKKISPVTVSPNIHYSAALLRRIEQLLKKYRMEDRGIWFEEWNSSIWQWDATNDTCFKAAWMLQDICENYEKVEAFGYWLLTDFIEERLPRNGAPYFGGFGMFNYNGIPKASYLALKLLRKMNILCIFKGEGCFVTRTESSLQILLYHYAHYDNMYRLCNQIPILPQQAYEVFLHRADRKYQIVIAGAPGGWCRIKKYRLNREHGSSFDKWVAMGQPQNLQMEEIQYLKNAVTPDMSIEIMQNNESISLETTIQTHECILYELVFK